LFERGALPKTSKLIAMDVRIGRDSPRAARLAAFVTMCRRRSRVVRRKLQRIGQRDFPTLASV
jgi:hypothetical protein